MTESLCESDSQRVNLFLSARRARGIHLQLEATAAAAELPSASDDKNSEFVIDRIMAARICDYAQVRLDQVAGATES